MSQQYEIRPYAYEHEAEERRVPAVRPAGHLLSCPSTDDNMKYLALLSTRLAPTLLL